MNKLDEGRQISEAATYKALLGQVKNDERSCGFDAPQSVVQE